MKYSKSRKDNFEPIFKIASEVTEIVVFSFVKKGNKRLLQDLDDIKTEVSVKVWRKLDTYTPSRGASFRTWVNSIALNTVRDYLNSYNKDHEYLVYADALDKDGKEFSYETHMLNKSDYDAEEVFISQENSKDIYDAIDATGDEVSEYLNMVIDGYKNREIAKEYGLSRNSLNVTLYRARRAIASNHNVNAIMCDYGMLR